MARKKYRIDPRGRPVRTDVVFDPTTYPYGAHRVEGLPDFDPARPYSTMTVEHGEGPDFATVEEGIAFVNANGGGWVNDRSRYNECVYSSEEDPGYRDIPNA
jgi:hypothetical protein